MPYREGVFTRIPDFEEVIKKPCAVCHGVKIREGEKCFCCEGRGWNWHTPKCTNKCQTCKLPPINPKFQIGDRFQIEFEGIGGHGKKGTITEVYYQPCNGNDYKGVLDDGVSFGDNEGNGEMTIKKIVREQKTLR